MVKVGDVIKVFVKELDREKGRISLGYKRDEENPWTIFSTQYKIGDVFDATVVSLTKFGAFVRILPGVDGLVHISEISTERLNEPGEALSVGDTVKVKLIGIDEERNRVSLSIKAALSEEEMEEFNAKIAEKKAIIAERKAKKAAKAAEKAAAEAEKAAEQDAAPEAEPAAEPAPEAAPAEEVKAEE